MTKTNFIDSIKVFVRSGKGGDGLVHFMRTKFNPRAGPDGGDGGRGGHIILKGNQHLWTLLSLRYQKNILAEDGKAGGARNATGRQGADRVIEVPVGTIAKDAITGKIEAEITAHNEEVIWLRGGKGGRGNQFFKNAIHQGPDFAQKGTDGSEGWKTIELKLLADVGLVGFPNAGKSTLLSVLSSAQPKIGAYPFTTLTPQLGIVSCKEGRGGGSFCMADLPGLIEGASQGKGLGHRFLRHIERNKVLLWVIAATEGDIPKALATLKEELYHYNPELMQKKQALAISKTDLLDKVARARLLADLATLPLPYVLLSAHYGEGLNDLKNILWQHLKAQ